MKLGIDARSSRELQAVILALKGADREIQKNIRDFTRQLILPDWKDQLLGRATTRTEVRLAESSRTKISNQNVTLQAAGVGSSKTFDVKSLGRYVEYGANRGHYSTYKRRSKNGGSHTVKRRVQTGMRPRRAGGYVALPTAKAMIPRFAALWVATAVRTFHDAFEGKRN